MCDVWCMYYTPYVRYRYYQIIRVPVPILFILLSYNQILLFFFTSSSSLLYFYLVLHHFLFLLQSSYYVYKCNNILCNTKCNMETQQKEERRKKEEFIVTSIVSSFYIFLWAYSKRILIKDLTEIIFFRFSLLNCSNNQNYSKLPRTAVAVLRGEM